jgi:transcriptional regulator with XRE-family HTH domain
MNKTDIHPYFKLVGENIAKYRKKRKLSQEGLGLEIGLTRMHINRIEKGDNLTLRTLLRLAIALDVDPYKLLKVDYPLSKDELEGLAVSKPLRKKA